MAFAKIYRGSYGAGSRPLSGHETGMVNAY